MSLGFIFSTVIAAIIGFITQDVLLSIGCFLVLYYTSTQIIKG